MESQMTKSASGATMVALLVWETMLFGCVCGYRTLSAEDRYHRDLLSAPASENIPVSEMQALWEIYDATNGDDWKWHTDTTQIPWNFSDPNANPCTDEWQGITCLYDGGAYQHVQQLALGQYNLQGILPNTLNELPRLANFSVCDNSLEGPIPASLGDLVELTSIALCKNKLSGPIPESLGNLTQLQLINLGTNGLTGTIPESLSNLHMLQVFRMESNHLVGTLPKFLGNYSHLNVLKVFKNHLVGTIPASLGNLSELLVLDLDTNHLNGTIPASLGNLAQLTYLDLDTNELTGTVPPSLGDLPQLQYLILFANQLRGTIPAILGGLSQLQYLDINANAFTGTIPASLGSLSQLLSLFLQNNQLTGPIPPSLGTLSQLVFLHLDNNHLNGTIPASLGDLTQLALLDLDHNELTGTVPASLGDLSRLELLILFSNRLQGTIPATLGNLSSLLYLDINTNALTGTIPASLGGLSELRYLLLYINELTGTMPASLGGLPNLLLLYLFINGLTGTIPAALGNLPQLQFLVLFTNELTGTIPAELGSLSQLQYLEVDQNRLTGPIPETLGQLHLLLAISASINRLTGTLPAFLGTFTRLRSIGLSNNTLEGPIPQSLGNLTQLLDLLVASNELTGMLPESLSKLHLLNYFVVGSNRLTGTLPDFLGSYAHLQTLVLANNSFVGTIPASIGNLSLLYELSADRNYLTGTIPRSIIRIPSLSSFMVDHNSLSGSLDGIFDAAVQRSLVTLVVNNNQFTGTIPSVIFDLPSLNTLVASTNCFHGQLPANICNCTSLMSLVMDGLSSAPACRNKLIPGLSRSYILKNSVHGTVPACLFQLPRLLTLHLSGNALTGGIVPDTTVISPGLVDLSLSHNELTGTIPLVLQNRSWVLLDLSYNRLRGSLSTSLAARDDRLSTSYAGFDDGARMSLSLENNRLSGHIPHSVQTLQDVSVLGTNTFSCKLDGSDLPQHDSGVSNYQCGSSEFDVPYYVWLGLCFVSAVLLSVTVRLRSRLQRYANVEEVLKRCADMFSAPPPSIAGSTDRPTATLGSAYRNILCFVQVLDAQNKHTVLWTAVIVIVLLPLYTALSHYSGTYLQAYAWTVSAAYLSGAVPFGLEMVLWLVLLCAAMTSMLMFSDAIRVAPVLPPVPSVIPATRYQAALIYVLFLGLNIVIVGGVNVAFVYVSIYRSSQLLTFAQICMSFFKVIYNGGVTTSVLNSIVHLVTGQDLHVSGYATLQALSALLNNIMIPFVTVLVISPSCFYNVFDAAPSVTTIYSYASCVTFDISTGECESSSPSFDTTSYDPPFAYSYQCSSSLVTYYAPAFVNLCIVSMFFMPVARLLAVKALRRADKSTRWFQLLYRAVPTTWKLPAIGETSDTTRIYFNPLREQLAQLNFVALIFTFGVVFPPLAAALAVTLLVCTVITKLKLGRLLQHACNHNGATFAQSVELACESLLGSALLRDFVGMLSVIACLFYTLFLFDTLGDAVGFHKAYWVLIVVPLLPVCVLLIASSPLFFGRLKSVRERAEGPAVEMAGGVTNTDTYNVML